MYNLDTLFEKAENYTKTSFELFKLKLINNATEIISAFISRGIVLIILSIFIFILNIGIALWLGELLGRMYYGFFCVAGFYALVGVILYFFLHKSIKRRISNSIVSQIFK